MILFSGVWKAASLFFPPAYISMENMKAQRHTIKTCAYRFGSMIYILNQSHTCPCLFISYQDISCAPHLLLPIKKHLKTIVTVFKGHMHRNIQWQIWSSTNFLDIDENLMHTFIHRHYEIKSREKKIVCKSTSYRLRSNLCILKKRRKKLTNVNNVILHNKKNNYSINRCCGRLEKLLATNNNDR